MDRSQRGRRVPGRDIATQNALTGKPINDPHIVAVRGIRRSDVCFVLFAGPAAMAGPDSGAGEPVLLRPIAAPVARLAHRRGARDLFFLRVAIERRTLGLAAGIAFNLGLLAFFKYKFLFIDAAAPSSAAPGTADLLLRLPLPIGISFFVLHNISLLIDLGTPGRHWRRSNRRDTSEQPGWRWQMLLTAGDGCDWITRR
jgi:hypothetical protein